MDKLGKSLERSTGKRGGAEINQTLDKLHSDWTKLDSLWASRNRRLEQGLDLQKLNKEADRIDASLSGHEARLRIQDVGVRKGK